MPESTSSQASTPNPFNRANNSDNQQNSGVGPNSAEPNAMVLEWNELQNYDIVPTSSTNDVDYQVPNNINRDLNQQMVLDTPNYMNIPYQRSPVPNAYTTLNPTRRFNAHAINGPHIIRAPNGQIISGPNWSNHTPLARFISQSSGWIPPSKTAGGVKKQKRVRTAFTSQQMIELEQEYARARYLDRARRIELAEILHLNERTIKIWFQNRRMKEKKDRAESLEDSEEASTTESSPEVTNSVQMPMLMQDQFHGFPNEVYSHGGIYVEQYPVSSTSAAMPSAGLSSSMPEVLTHPVYMKEDEYQSQYQQVHLQVHQYPPPYGNEVQELSPESLSQPETPAANGPSDIIEKSWDLSWIQSIKIEDEY